MDCPRCHQPVETTAIVCPHCRATLKAHGHPGMPLYRASGKEPLCVTCVYHEDDSCNFPKRPYAMDCTLYNDHAKQQALLQSGYTPGFLLQTWLKRNVAWLLLLALLLVSLLVALVR